MKTHSKVANFWIMYLRVIYLVELLNNKNEECNTSQLFTSIMYPQTITLLMKAYPIFPIKCEGHLSHQIKLFQCFLTNLKTLYDDNHWFTKVKQKN